MMKTTKGIASVIARTTILCEGKYYVFVFIITNPLIATWCFRQVFTFAAQPTLWFRWSWIFFINRRGGDHDLKVMVSASSIDEFISFFFRR
jgi:hypothetical protein